MSDHSNGGCEAMLTVTLEDVQVRIAILEARKSFAEASLRAGRDTVTVTVRTGECLGLDAGLKVLKELEAFFLEGSFGVEGEVGKGILLVSPIAKLD